MGLKTLRRRLAVLETSVSAMDEDHDQILDGLYYMSP